MIQFLLGILYFFSAIGESAEIKLTAAQIYYRCYSQIVRARPLQTDPLLVEVQKNRLSGASACMQLLRKARLSKEGLLLRPKDKLSQEILKTLQLLHNSWFPRYEFNESTQDYINTNFYDSNEMGYHLTYGLLSEGQQFKTLFTRRGSFTGVREKGKTSQFANTPDISGKLLPLDPKQGILFKVGGKNEHFGEGGSYFWKPKLIEFGNLIGLKKMKADRNRFVRMEEGHRDRMVDMNYPAFRGVMGTKAYLLLNAGHTDSTVDGGKVLHRRWATSVFSDLLCRSLPVIRRADSLFHKKEKSQFSFRKQEACVHCHASSDTLAKLTRNLENFNFGDVDINYTGRAIF
ncbi:MAG: hypothetical protein HOM21_13110 [Halobacteriovoraceae bacterium]|jgi:hypothetical protein|nr:hypothetical protein [Halobacteriovoraceae bacterium]